MLDCSKLKEFASNKMNVTKKLKLLYEAFSPFQTVFSKGLMYRVHKRHDCVVKG